MRVLIAVTHLLGAGHLTRAAAIGRALAAGGAEVTLVSGGRPAPLIDVGSLDLVQLPPLCTRIGEFRVLRDENGDEVGAAYLSRRREELLRAFGRSAPQIVVTELFPFGRRALAGEFTALIEAASARTNRPLVAASIRDILAPPSTPAKAAQTHALVERFYDLVLIHGDASVAPLDASWPVDPGLATRLVYTGYVDGEPPRRANSAADSARSDIVVSGGSSVAGLPLYRAALAAARLDRRRRWRVLVGAAVPEALFADLMSEAGANVLLERARADFRRLLAEARVFVGQAGYNTVMDLFATGVPAVLVPFEQGGETEQRLRAGELAKRGCAQVLPEAELTAATLLAAVEASDGAAVAGTRAAVSRDGAQRSADILLDRARERVVRSPAIAEAFA